MKAIFQKLVRKELADSIPHDDLIERLRFALFRIYSFTSPGQFRMTAAQILVRFPPQYLDDAVCFERDSP